MPHTPPGEPHPVQAVGVVIPAQDEEDRIVACLHSVHHALDQLPADITVAITVVLDRCRDRTPSIVAAACARWPQLSTVNVAALGGRRPVGRRAGHSGPAAPLHVLPGSGVGALRDLGVPLSIDCAGTHQRARGC